MDSSAFGARLREARLSAGIPSLAEASRRLGIADETIWRYENGRIVPGLAQTAKLALAYGCSIDWLVTGAEHALKPTGS